MFRLSAKVIQNGHVLRETVVEDDSSDTRTHKVLHALNRAVMELDLAEPMWLDKNIHDFQRHAKCRFTQDSFVEEIDFDYFEIAILEEDDFYGT
jgi:hypothetical protein